MNKNLIKIAGITLGVLLVALIVGAVVVFHGNGSSTKKEAPKELGRSYAILSAVPCDALGVASDKNLGELLTWISTNKPTAKYINRSHNKEFFRLADGLCASESSLKGLPAAISFDYNGHIIPLLIVDLGKTSSAADWSVLQSTYPKLKFATVDITAASSLLKGRKVLFISPEQYLIESASRKITIDGGDISKAEGFTEALSECKTDAFMIVQNNALGKFFKNNIASRFNFALDWAKHTATWMALTPEKAASQFSLSYVFTKGRTEYFSMYNELSESRSALSNVLASSVDFVISIPIANSDRFIEAYKQWFDFNGNSIDFKKRGIDFTSAAAAKGGRYSAEWIASNLKIDEVSLVQTPKCKVLIISIENLVSKILRPQSGESVAANTIYSFPYNSLAATICGNIFDLNLRKNDYKISVGNDYQFVLLGDDLVISDSRNLKQYLSELENGGRFFDTYAGGITPVDKALYWALRKTPQGDYLIAEGHETRSGIQKVTLTLYNNLQGGEVVKAGIGAISQAASEAVPAPKPVPAPKAVEPVKPAKAEPAATIKVPTGPWKVKNSATGQMNTLSQNSSNYQLTLKDEKGVSKWTIKLGGPIAGKVESVDYYKNGKLQYLFIVGRDLYLVDRLGRNVNGFPKKLKEDVVLGPGLYDFNNKKRYNIMVLTEGNTIEMYNLEAAKPQSWKSIAPDKQIAKLPARKIVNGKTRWEVTFTDGTTKTYPFLGGEIK